MSRFREDPDTEPYQPCPDCKVFHRSTDIEHMPWCSRWGMPPDPPEPKHRRPQYKSEPIGFPRPYPTPVEPPPPTSTAGYGATPSAYNHPSIWD